MTPQRIKQVNKSARKIALVTGGAVRLGRAISLELALAGYDVAGNYHHSAVAARATASAIGALGGRPVSILAQVAKPLEVRRLVAETMRWLGRFDPLVNNAGVFRRTPWNTVTSADFDRFIAVNVKGAFFCSQAAARAMGRRGGRIVNLADVGALRAWPGYIPYAISKAGMAMLTRGLAAAVAPESRSTPWAGRSAPASGFPARGQEAASGQDPQGQARPPGRLGCGCALLRHLPRLHHRPGPVRGRRATAI
jgi:pteridine reductase